MSEYIYVYDDKILDEYLEKLNARKDIVNRSTLRLLANELKIELSVGRLKTKEFYDYIRRPKNIIRLLK
ncbi:hypothetical protein [Vibrio campbellii]|uniref:Uncharacterized protein n=2 Tax=Vibrio campbellii TaxID=680 RepID=A0ACC7RHR4_9VIBR|nr:hypothetical protein [Vibrio campbellii]CAD7819041.1 hypothetical protein ACOMICROBIO_LMKGKHOH_04201 [Vibrio sp. B1FIG11]APX09618.1 hypothetical protein BWP24_26125 [Vibrio campbellii]AQM69759.1 hypothetical protein Vca1114GL_03333 [Vibrio campbellii]ARR47042.1 hypothetical protein CAY59_22780 [Vibrio campbellii]AYO12744.1 hypothetical protein D0784_26045 [Vibrio campbellii]